MAGTSEIAPLEAVRQSAQPARALPMMSTLEVISTRIPVGLCLPTMACWIQLMRSGVHTQRASANA